MQNNSQKGFTLLELSFVVIIISIIIAAVASGSSLIKQTQLKSIITESNDFLNAVNLFQQKYGSLPGDFPTAGNVWGTSCDSNPTNCNGDGDGFIKYTSSTNQNEGLRAWQHLSLAGMIKGYYTGVSTVAKECNIGINSPTSNYTPAAWGFWKNNTYTPPSESTEGQFLQVGRFQSGNPCIAAIFTPLDAYSIDDKIDDGYPRNGMVLGYSNASNCYTTVSLTSTYNFNLQTNACILKFVFNIY